MQFDVKAFVGNNIDVRLNQCSLSICLLNDSIFKFAEVVFCRISQLALKFGRKKQLQQNLKNESSKYDKDLNCMRSNYEMILIFLKHILNHGSKMHFPLFGFKSAP